MKTKVVKDGPIYRRDKHFELYKKVVNLLDGESLVIEKATKEEYDRIRVYFSFKKNSVRSKYLYDMAFSKGIRFSVHGKLSYDRKYMPWYKIWIQKKTDDTAV